MLWIPRETHCNLKTFIEALKKESKTEEEVIKTIPMNNLTKIELQRLVGDKTAKNLQSLETTTPQYPMQQIIEVDHKFINRFSELSNN